MPELPEVETVARDLRPLLTGRTIRTVRQSQLELRRPWRAEFNRMVLGKSIQSVTRRGKWLLIELGPNGVLRVHLGMTGQFTVIVANAPQPDHLHLVFGLDNDHELRLRDPRRFGSAEYFPESAALLAQMNQELGPEPFGIDATYFRTALNGTNRILKAILLDQQVVAGVGNIYADESLFRARLHPARRGNSLTANECDRLRLAIESVIGKAIASRGSTIRDYIGGSGLRGDFQNELAVYGRDGEPCPVCEKLIVCVRLAGRASHHCPNCQPDGPPLTPKTPKPTLRKSR